MIWTIPNILTIGRLIAAPCVALVFVFVERPMADWLAFWIFAGAAVTDFFDGWLARKLDQVSEFGKMLDPIADKAIVVIALTVFMSTFANGPFAGGSQDLPFPSGLLVAPIVLILFREVLIAGVREYLGDVKLSVTKMAKWKTTFQMVAIAMLLLSWPVFSSDWRNLGIDGEPTRNHLLKAPGVFLLLGTTFLWLAAILTIITGWDYFRKAMAHLKEREAS